jgi:hypothetical protein
MPCACKAGETCNSKRIKMIVKNRLLGLSRIFDQIGIGRISHSISGIFNYYMPLNQSTCNDVFLMSTYNLYSDVTGTSGATNRSLFGDLRTLTPCELLRTSNENNTFFISYPLCIETIHSSHVSTPSSTCTFNYMTANETYPITSDVNNMANYVAFSENLKNIVQLLNL